MVHLIVFDLRSPNDARIDYERVTDALKDAFPVWARIERSVWIIDSDRSADEVRDALRDALNKSDSLFVARLEGSWASRNANSSRVEWLRRRRFRTHADAESR